MKKIFISGSYTQGDVAQNVKRAMDIANELIELGFIPYCPHLSHFLHINNPREYEIWLKIDIEFLKICDAVLRFPGRSDGADKEVLEARRNNIPVFYTIKDLLILNG